MKGIAEDSRLDGLCSTAFVGSLEEESEPRENKTPIEGIEGDKDIGENMDNADGRDLEADMMEQLPLPGYPQKEQDRRKKWLEIPEGHESQYDDYTEIWDTSQNKHFA